MREIVLDTETTGLDPAQGHRLIEIGCVELIGRLRTGNSFHCYINPERDVPEEAQRVHGISTDFLKDKPLFAHIAEEMLAFIGDAPLVIHNAQFDLKFLNHELARLEKEALDKDRKIVDTVLIARRKFPGAPANLDALCRRFNVDLSGREKHGALLDAELLADVYLELMGGRQESLSLEKEKIVTASAASSEQKITISYRTFPPTEEELRAHADFVKKLKNPLWGTA